MKILTSSTSSRSERADVIKDAPAEDHQHQIQSGVGLQILRQRYALLAAITAVVITVSLFAITTDRSMGNTKNQEILIHDNSSSSLSFTSAKISDIHKMITNAQFYALPLPTQVLLHPKNDIENRIRELRERHRNRESLEPNHEEIVMQLERELRQNIGIRLVSDRSKRRLPHNPLQEPDIDQEEETKNKKYEENEKHPRDVRLQETKSTSLGNKISHMKQNYKLNRNNKKICDTPECFEAAKRISQSLNLSANPCDDFYEFACGGWIADHSLPSSGWTGTFVDARKRMNKRLLQILKTPAEEDAPPPLHYIRFLFNSCKDTDTMNELGLDPLVKLISAGQGGWPMVKDDWKSESFRLSTALNSLRSLDVYPLLYVAVNIDIFDTSRFLLYVDAGDVPLGSNIMELLDRVDKNYLKPYATFMATAAKMLRDSIGSSVTDQEIEAQVKDVIDFEIRFSKIVTKAENESTNLSWKTNVRKLQEDTDAFTPHQFDWLNFLNEMFAELNITITQDEPLLSFKGPFFRDFSNLIAITDAKTIANAVGWWWVYSLSKEATYDLRDASRKFIQDFYGSSESTHRQHHCLDIANRNMAFALSSEYAKKFVSGEVKADVKELVSDLRAAFASILKVNKWMLPKDQQVALEKLEAMHSFVGYPDWIMNEEKLTQAYEDMELIDGEHMKNLVTSGMWLNLKSLAALRHTPEKMFLYPPATVNAVYTPTQNSITILSGMLQLPFYNQGSLAALNYGSIGMIIGHEMTHGFDSIGRMFDKSGNLRQWWSDKTIEAFKVHALCFVMQYYNYVPKELSEIGSYIPVNGLQTLPENIADNGGLREAFKAYKTYVKRNGEEPRLPGLEDLSPEQLFYLSFANGWCEKKSPDIVARLLILDTHSPGRFRVEGPISNDEEFSKVWNCPPTARMNKGNKRCLLW